MNWRPVVGYEGFYEVSDAGLLRSVERYEMSRGQRRIRYGILHRLTPGSFGYIQAQLCRDGRPRQPLLHRLVAAAFIGPCPKGMQVNHKNGDKTDNRVENLEYVTSSQNNLHKTRVLGKGRGTGNGRAKLTDEQVTEMRRLAATGVSICELARRFGVGRSPAARAVRGQAWLHLPLVPA